MSQAAKQILTIFLGVSLLAALGFALITSLDKDRLVKEKAALTKQLDDYQMRERNGAVELKNIKDKLAAVEKERNELASKVSNVGGDITEMDARIKDITRERDDLKRRFDTLQEERDELAKKLTDKSQALADVSTKTAQIATGAVVQPDMAGLKQEPVPGSPDDENYVAQILKEKVALQMDLDQIKGELSKSALEVSELKKQNSDLQMEISKLNTDREAIAREIKYGSDLAKNLSIELARAQNEKQFMSDRMEKILNENSNLHEQLKNLTSTKIALEKSIVKLQGDKKDVEGKLLETEGVIQNRIEQIYQLKDSLEKDFKPSVKNSKGEVELSPIVVKSGDKGAMDVQDPKGGLKGNIVSVNDENNFVIVNLGEDAGVRTGDRLNVYRGPDYIAGLEVIQVRKDISAADIKSKMTKIEVGDSVR